MILGWFLPKNHLKVVHHRCQAVAFMFNGGSCSSFYPIDAKICMVLSSSFVVDWAFHCREIVSQVKHECYGKKKTLDLYKQAKLALDS